MCVCVCVCVCVISSSILLRIGSSKKNLIKTHFMFNIFFFENPAIYEIVWKNMVETDRGQMEI